MLPPRHLHCTLMHTPMKFSVQQITGQVEIEEHEKLNIGIVFSGECEKLAKEMYGEVRPTYLHVCV
jgi:hypothetical protein